ncbi:MAG: Bro-N domain-containing protein [Candidatus Aenigmarchaeota archaeon]|nr:Bro-N domain-containing protein [Candidatus Aenigmarchaeota archaeon]
MDNEDKIIVFENKKIRRLWHNDEWWFSVVDVVGALTDSSIPRRYWSDLKPKLKEEGFELYEKIVQLKLISIDGKKYDTDCANTKSLFRIIQSIPSKRAEPFKRWLAKVGYERIQEIENPELAQDRAKEYYELKGYPKSWIDKRLRGIAVRQELTGEWKNRGIKRKKDFAILTNEISKATFDITINQHKKFKGLNSKFKNQNLRDHMTDLELIFNMLGEKVTTEITKKEDSKGFVKCKDSAKRGGNVAKKARVEAEKEIDRKVVSKENYLDLKEKKKKELK